MIAYYLFLETSRIYQYFKVHIIACVLNFTIDTPDIRIL